MQEGGTLQRLSAPNAVSKNLKLQIIEVVSQHIQLGMAAANLAGELQVTYGLP